MLILPHSWPHSLLQRTVHLLMHFLLGRVSVYAMRDEAYKLHSWHAPTWPMSTSYIYSHKDVSYTQFPAVSRLLQSPMYIINRDILLISPWSTISKLQHLWCRAPSFLLCSLCNHQGPLVLGSSQPHGACSSCLPISEQLCPNNILPYWLPVWLINSTSSLVNTHQNHCLPLLTSWDHILSVWLKRFLLSSMHLMTSTPMADARAPTPPFR